MPAGRCVAKHDASPGRSTDVSVGDVGKYLLYFFRRNAMLQTVLHVAIGIIVEIPDNLAVSHDTVAQGVVL
jgi:hypothetical protein